MALMVCAVAASALCAKLTSSRHNSTTVARSLSTAMRGYGAQASGRSAPPASGAVSQRSRSVHVYSAQRRGRRRFAYLFRGAMQALRCGPPVAASAKRRGAAHGGARAAQRGPEPAPEAARRAVVFAPPLALLAAALSPAGPAHAGASAAALAAARSNGNSANNNGFEYMPALNDKDYGKVRCGAG